MAAENDREGEGERDEMDRIIDRYRQQDATLPSQKTPTQGEPNHIESREYQAYKEAERHAEEQHWYEKLCGKAAQVHNDGISVPEGQRETLEEARRFLDFDLELEHGMLAGVLTGAALFLAVFFFFLLNSVILPSPVLPSLLVNFFFLLPLIFGYYIAFYPKYAAQTKMLRSSESVILAVLYMVVYMRSSPNLEGATRFAAVHLTGPIAEDLRRVLWRLEVGEFSTIEDALSGYVTRWKPYNREFVEAIEILQTSLQTNSKDRRNQLYNEALDTILSGSRSRMEEFSRALQLPVAVIQGLGMLLPVLGMVLFPLVASFIGGDNMSITLFLIYNVIIPGGVYILLRRVLMNRPPTIISHATNPDLLPSTGRYTFYFGERSVTVPVWMPAVAVTLLLTGWPVVSYTLLFLSGNGLSQAISPVELFRSLLLVMGVGLGMGTYLYLGYQQRARFQERLQEMEEEFPEAIFQLGAALKGQRPIELGVSRAVDNMRDLDIADLFDTVSGNIRELGMTFEQALFDGEYGALQAYPSQLIATVMNAVVRSVGKGPRIAAQTLTTISEYLQDIRGVQEKIKDLMEETLTSIQFMAYILAPVVAGVSVGLGVVVTKALQIVGVQLEQVSNITQTGATPTGQGPAPGAGLGGGGALEFFQFESAVPPELLQIIIGIYVILLSILLAMFYTRLRDGRNKTKEAMRMGRYLIVSILIYAVVALLITALFGGVIENIQTIT